MFWKLFIMMMMFVLIVVCLLVVSEVVWFVGWLVVGFYGYWIGCILIEIMLFVVLF